MNYQAPWWLPEGHSQTIWSALYARRGWLDKPIYRRERWQAPDQDFVDVDWLVSPLPPPPSQPLLVLFHGLEGSSHSHYAQAFAACAQSHHWGFAVPHFRGCSGEANLAPRAYHSGDIEEIDWILTRLRQLHEGPLFALGVSLGGNALMRWAGEMGAQASTRVNALCSISAPLDLRQSGMAIGRGINRWIYTRMFLRSMKPKALAKLAQHPGLFDKQAMLASRNLYEFDNVFTAPLHGFAGTDDYWMRASAKPHLHQVRVPSLVINARNDPFIPAQSLPTQAEVSSMVRLWQPQHGGHVGFAQGSWPAEICSFANSVVNWFLSQAGGVTSVVPYPLSRLRERARVRV